MKVIPLTQGKEVIVDDEDYEYLNQWKWFFKKGYPARNITISKNKRKTIFLYNILLNPEPGYIIDHIDGNPLNNLKSNLRLTTKSQNNQNRTKSKFKSSKYKGVSWYKKLNKWRAFISVNYKFKHIGLFESEVDAAKAYNTAALTYFKDYAKLNKV